MSLLLLFNAQAAAFTLTTVEGALAISGAPAALSYATPTANILGANAGSLTATGRDAKLTPAYVLTANGGAFACAGSPATMAAGLLFNAAAGNASITGAQAALTLATWLSAAAGNHGVTGASATLNRNLQASADPATYTSAGAPASFIAGKVLEATPLNYAITGAAAVFKAPHWPSPAQVQNGVQYGPTGSELTGTMTGGAMQRGSVMVDMKTGIKYFVAGQNIILRI